eukprot:GAHX01006617.1.p2 GENE.GAHX01006617.1~~GAHX01006617.1.p2  ORF type:complete len:50 (+),score=1.86 GAHX01006617.1:150-299(+)
MTKSNLKKIHLHIATKFVNFLEKIIISIEFLKKYSSINLWEPFIFTYSL